MTAEKLKERLRASRDELDENLAVRLHRAIEQLKQMVEAEK